MKYQAFKSFPDRIEEEDDILPGMVSPHDKVKTTSCHPWHWTVQITSAPIGVGSVTTPPLPLQGNYDRPTTADRLLTLVTMLLLRIELFNLKTKG